MSNYTSCIFILTQLIGFEKSDNDEKITLPDQVEIETLVQLKNFLLKSSIESKSTDESSYVMRKIDNDTAVNNESTLSFWSCHYCAYNNSINSKACQICGFPCNVCVNHGKYFILIDICLYVLFA